MPHVGFIINQHKNEKKDRNCQMQKTISIVLSFLRPNLNEIIKKHKAQISH